MNWKKTFGLALFLTLCAWYLSGQKSLDYKSNVRKYSALERAPASIKLNVIRKEKPSSDLDKSGLTKEKIAAILQLQDFLFSRPAFTEENIRKREVMLETFLINPKDTVAHFSKLMQNSKDDELKGFLLNLTMNSKLEDEEKADIFLARLKAGADISKEGLVPDENISFMIGISHLSRLENESVKEQAQEKLKESILSKDVGFQNIYKDYFKESQ